MSGHSKWSTIKHQKGVTDKKRGKTFSSLVKQITLAVRSGGDDPTVNFKLRMAMDKAKAANMPKDNITRAIKRGLGVNSNGAGGLAEVIYEGFGPLNAAVLVECLSDNTNRTLAEIKSYFEKKGYSLGSMGSVSYLFTKKGRLTIVKGDQPQAEELALIDFNPDELIEKQAEFEMIIPADSLASVQKTVSQAEFKVSSAELIYFPKIKLTLADKADREKLQQFIDDLYEFDDVVSVYVNYDLD